MIPPAAILALALLGLPSASAGVWELESPDRACGITLRLGGDGQLVYRVTRAGKTVLRDSPLGLIFKTEEFAHDLEFHEATATAGRRESYELFAGIAPQVDTVLNHRSVAFRNRAGTPLVIDLVAGGQGVAFRYRLENGSQEPCELMEERSGFHPGTGAVGWLQPYHAAGKYTPAYEDFYFKVSPGDPPPHSRAEPLGWCFPALFHVPSARSWVLVTEVTGDDPYPACHLAPGSSDGIYRIAFPRKNEKGMENPEGGNSPALPRNKLPWIMPWRAIILGPDPAAIATSTLVTDLAPPSRIADTGWIKPGRASWAWWSQPEGPFSAESFHASTDLAVGMGWEYTLFDANWWDPGITPLVRHAAGRSIGPMMWTHARDYESPEKMRRKLDEIAACGAIGFKADFWCSDRQETMETLKSLFAEAAERKLLVNLHGGTLPRGWHRTWPNFMTAEAVLGAESYLYESRFTEKAAEFNTVLPFARNVAGPMDYTPVAVSPKRYRRTTTAAHELATSIIFTSGIIHYADSPDFFGNLPQETTAILRDAPARWDETLCLAGDPGRLAVFARRSGDTWFIAGISGSDQPLPLSLDLAEFSRHPRRILVSEGEDPTNGVREQITAASDRWQHTIPPRGGFILRLDP